MKKLVTTLLIAAIGTGVGTAMAADNNAPSAANNFNPLNNPSDPAKFAQEYRDYFYKNFPQIPHDKYNMGVYAFDKDAFSQYQDMMQFPPQDDYIAAGKKFWEDYRLPNGKPLSSCVGDAKGLRAKYPYFNTKDGKVHDLESDLVNCQLNAGVPKDKSLGSKKGYNDLASVSAYLSSMSQGLKVDVKVPSDPKAVAAFNNGKHMFFRKTGQLNMSCADCHMYHATQMARSETLHPGMGNTTGFPVFRYSKGKMITLNNRLFGCMRDTRTIPFKQYSSNMLDLEYFLAYIDNGLEINGPALRK